MNTEENGINISLRDIFIGLSVIGNVIIICWLYFLDLGIKQNNKEIQVLKNEIVTNNKNFAALYREVDLINRNFTRAVEEEIAKEVELETAYDLLEQERNRTARISNETAPRSNILPEEEKRIVERFQNALFNEQGIKAATLTNLDGTQILLPISEKARNKNSKEYIKNLLGKLKTQYYFDDYKIEIVWEDETKSSI